MNRLFAIFSVTAVVSASLVAAAATGAFEGDGATNAARPRAVRSSPGGGSDEEDADSVRRKALDALKEKRDSGEIPREEGQAPAEEAPGFLQGPDIKPADPTPAVEATSPEPATPEAGEGRVSPATGEDGEPAKKGIAPERVKEIVEERSATDPYKVTGPKVSTDPRSGTTIINTSPY